MHGLRLKTQAPCRVPGPPGQAVPQSAEVEGSPGGNWVDATQGAAGRQVSQGERATLPEPVCACPEPVLPANWQGVDEAAFSLITVTSGASLSTQVDPTATGAAADIGSSLPSKAHDERRQDDAVQPHKKVRLEGAQRHGNAAPGLPPVLRGLAHDAKQGSLDVVGVFGQNEASHFRPCREAEPEPVCHAPQPVLQGSFGTAGHGQSQATAGSLAPEIDDASRCGTKTSFDVPRREGRGKCPKDVTHTLPKPVLLDPKPALTPHPRVNGDRPLGKVDFKQGPMNNGTPCQVVGSNRLAGEDGQLQIPKAVLVPYRGRSSSTVAHILAALGGQDRLLVAFDSSLRLLPRQMVVPQDQEIFVWRPDVKAGRGMPPGFRAPFPTDLPHAQIMAPEARKRILLEQQGWVADDQAAFALSLIAACARSPVKVIPPVTAQALFENADLQGVKDAIGCLRECDSLVTMFLVGNLWIGASWTVEGKQVRAWSTACPKGEVGEALGQVDCLVAKALGSQVRDFRFSSAPSRPPVHGLCGHFALADLLYHVLGLEPPSLDQAPALLSAAFELGLNADRLVSAPHLIGGGPSLLEAGLAATLREHGVPAAQAGDRAIEVIQTIGKAGIQKALEGPQAWKELKALATSAKLQLVLPSELQAVAAARGPARRRQRQTTPQPGRHAGQKDPVPRILPPSPESVRIPEGVFVKGDGAPLKQIASSDIGPQAEGVVLATWAEAKPYLDLEAPVSKAALALVVLGESLPVTENARVAKIRFQAVSLVCNEPVLLGAALIQIGDTWASKAPPKVLAPLDLVPSNVVRVAAYRDQVTVAWEAFHTAPMRTIVQIVEALQVCKTLSCACPKWHGLSAPGEPSPLLEVWQRQFCNEAYQVAAPANAAIFNVNIRIPAALTADVLASSGLQGVYFEPRGEHVGEASKEYQVTWMPKLTFAEILVQKQQHEEVIGLARVGMRYGLRTHVTNAKALHLKVRPEVPYLPKAEIRSFHVGPVPFGTQRQALTVMLETLPWATKPLHPIPGQRDAGVWWRVHATTAPPTSVVFTKHGEVLIVEQSEREQETRQAPAVVGSRQTIRQ